MKPGGDGSLCAEQKKHHQLLWLLPGQTAAVTRERTGTWASCDCWRDGGALVQQGKGHQEWAR